MTRNEFIDIVEKYNDIELKIGNDNYTILTWTDMGITIARANETPQRGYSNAQSLLESFSVEGTPLSKILGTVELIFAA